MKNTDIKIILTEALFSQSVKTGQISINVSSNKKIEFPLTTLDVKELSRGKILMKKIDEYIINLVIQQMTPETIREILKRTPLYSSIAEDII